MAGQSYDAVVVGAGPNGLAAAITLARAGRSVLVLEAAERVGGGCRSAELTLPGFVHDVCSAIHPLGVASPFFKSTPLADFGLQWIFSEAAAAHPFLDGSATLVKRSVAETMPYLGDDAEAYRRFFEPLAERAGSVLDHVLDPLRFPRHPLLLARFGLSAIRSARSFATGRFKHDQAQGMLAGMAAHSVRPLDRPLTAGVALMFLLTAHDGGWPLPRGGSQQIADAMAAYLRSLGGEIVTGRRIEALNQVPRAKAMLFDLTPRQLVQIAGDALPHRYQRRLDRFRHGPGVFKVDWALAGPVPWKNPDCTRAATVHLGGTFDEIAAAESAPWQGEHPEWPFVLFAQQSLFDPTRAPAGRHTGWGYCHVPHRSSVDMTERIEAQIERFAPGFRDLILERHAMGPADFERYNANYIGGDITGGVMDLRQTFARPLARLVPYATPNRGIYLCSSSTPPGAGVHGMCGHHAARAALSRVLR